MAAVETPRGVLVHLGASSCRRDWSGCSIAPHAESACGEEPLVSECLGMKFSEGVWQRLCAANGTSPREIARRFWPHGEKAKWCVATYMSMGEESDSVWSLMLESMLDAS